MPNTYTYNLDEIDLKLEAFWQLASQFSLIAFVGDMGAGKTTYISHLCKFLNVQDKVSSPTFSLINEYHFKNNENFDKIIYHIDLYRLKNTEEAINAGIVDCIEHATKTKNYCLIEWPQIILELFPTTYLFVNITLENELVRTMELIVK